MTRSSRDVLGPEHSEHDAGDVVRAASPTDLTADERADLYMDEAEALLETNWERAWQRTVQAVNLLGDHRLSNSIADPAARNEIRRRALAVVAYRTLDATGEARRIDDDTVHRLVTTDRDPNSDDASRGHAGETDRLITALEYQLTTSLLGIFDGRPVTRMRPDTSAPSGIDRSRLRRRAPGALYSRSRSAC